MKHCRHSLNEKVRVVFYAWAVRSRRLKLYRAAVPQFFSAMVLVDACIWVDYLCVSDAVLANLLINNRVLTHPYVLGELVLVGRHAMQR